MAKRKLSDPRVSNKMGLVTKFNSNRLSFFGTYLAITLLIISSTLLLNIIPHVNSISIKPADFDRFVMSCYLGSSGGNGYTSSGSSYYQNSAGQGNGGLANPMNPQANLNGAGYGSSQIYGRLAGENGRQTLGSNVVPNQNGASNGYQPSYYGQDTNRQGGFQPRDGLSTLGQQIPRASTIENFIALVTKIESANPRLANNPDQLIRTLLGRFRLDNYYYDVRSKIPISEVDYRTTDILPALLNGAMSQQQMQPQYILSADVFPEHLLDHDEKCSMYYMLSHFVDKTSPMSPPLASQPISQISGPQTGQRPPSLQAAGAGYPGLSANYAFSNGTGGSSRYPGPSPSFGSPATSNMNSFGAGLSNQPDYSGRNPYGVNVPQPNTQFNQNYNNIRNAGQYSGTLASNTRYSTPFLEGGARSRDERIAVEYGVVNVGNQDNSAIVLNRVLMGILAASTPPQTLRQLASTIYSTQPLTTTPKIDEEIDPLYAVTLADLWAISSIPKAGKVFDFRLMGDNGRWNDTMCPTSFQLDRANSIRFTTAELLGGLDGFNLGMLRRRLIGMRKNIRLSELLKMYYSRTGFRPQFAEVGVCNRGFGINTQLDDLRRQAENYLRLYQLNLPVADTEIATSINKLDYFKEVTRQAASQYTPSEICQDSNFNDIYPMGNQDQCEVARADVVTLLDSSPQANAQFMNLVVVKLAQKLGLSQDGNSLTVLTNQQDTTGYAGAYSFNAIVRNSTNTAEIGCSLVHDRSQGYQGGQITDPTRLVEMFERALVNLDSEYLIRQTIGQSSVFRQSSSSSFMSSLFQSESNYGASMFSPVPKNTGGAKIIIWFNYGPQARPSQLAASPTNWNGNSNGNSDAQYKFEEAKRYLRENFRGASILAVASSQEDVKDFVYDKERDIFTDLPQGSNVAAISSPDYYSSSSDPNTMMALSGPADQLVTRLMQRMCDIPAVFQYPLCFRAPSENALSVGYISPGRKQYWMMSPKTFFASHAVRMIFKVDGGRLRVCFGRMPKPDETAARSGQQQQQYYQPGPITLSNGQQVQNGANPNSNGILSTSSDYYTGMDYGVCKDVSPGQEIDFVVTDPCWKKPIAECEPFYYAIKEISNQGEGDPNYMCRDEGCKRFDQVKFTMTHTGVTCSSAFGLFKCNIVVLSVSLMISLMFSSDTRGIAMKPMGVKISSLPVLSLLIVGALMAMVKEATAQQANVYDYGQGRYGEKRGSFTPFEVLAIILIIMTILGGLALTIGLCYYVTKKSSRGQMTPVKQDDYEP